MCFHFHFKCDSMCVVVLAHMHPCKQSSEGSTPYVMTTADVEDGGSCVSGAQV